MATTMHPYDIAAAQGAVDAKSGREPDPATAVKQMISQAGAPVTEMTKRVLIDFYCTGYYSSR